jgi:hypothetical protein
VAADATISSWPLMRRIREADVAWAQPLAA